ncbi:isochorismate synthase [Bacteroides salyersiae]|uniref:isochorismate synthase n=1 Tax=Bacteroides salyersiae TaxID=291644 RepID=UPI001CCC3ECE|nr:isochorismate synthase [Bacteroides salyersiae]UBD18214.1 isochorismate synthase [Bacteroides salyersiae]
MDALEQDICAGIDRFIKLQIPFAIYRIPGENVVHFVSKDPGDPCVLLYDIEELNGQAGFVIAPFNVGPTTPIVLLRPEREMVVDFDPALKCPGGIQPDVYRQMLNNQVVSLQDGSSTEGYAGRFDVFMDALKKKEFNKLVLSRSQKVNVPLLFSPATAFYEACRRYIYSYVYFCYTPHTGAWLGSTPEIILSGERNKWNTVALAGTQSLQNGELPREWDDKNREEQEYVASYIRSQLLSLGIQPAEFGPYPAFAGALSHLKTDFHFSLPDNDSLGDLLKLLHPTPAVCGLPKEKAYQFILDHEDHERRYYSGFIGMLNPDGKTDLYVNLRCMNITSEVLTLYAGGGLLASSELEDEWQETEKKMRTMKNLIMC